VATAIRGAISILAKQSIEPLRRSFWGNKISKPDTVPTKVGLCCLVHVFQYTERKVIHFGHNNIQHNYTMNGNLLAKAEKERDIGVDIWWSLKLSDHCTENIRSIIQNLRAEIGMMTLETRQSVRSLIVSNFLAVRSSVFASRSRNTAIFSAYTLNYSSTTFLIFFHCSHFCRDFDLRGLRFHLSSIFCVSSVEKDELKMMIILLKMAH